MISDYYVNKFITYRLSGSITSDGSYIESGSLYVSGSGRIKFIANTENISTYNFYCDMNDISVLDAIYIDGEPYQITGILNYYDHHLTLKLQDIDTSLHESIVEFAGYGFNYGSSYGIGL